MIFEDEFDGDISRYDSLTAVPEPAKKRGRPQSLDDGRLWGVRSALLDMLEGRWGQIGWELKRARTPQQLRAALMPIAGSHRNHIELFVRTSITRATPQTARATQKRLGEIAAKSRACAERQRQFQDKLDKVKWALSAVQGTPREAEMEIRHKERQQALDAVVKEYHSIQEQDNVLIEHFRNQQAYIAQTELLDFLRSDRYSFTPLNVANAMAGLPYMSWRQSAKRSYTLERPPVQGFSYQLFSILSRAIKRSSSGQLLADVENYLLKRPKTDLTAGELRKKWYYLKRSINEVLRSRVHPGSIPYRVLFHYQQKVSTPTQVDLVFEEEDQL